MERIAQGLGWPEMYSDISRLCAGCEHCQRENRHTAHTAWTRTELYSRPFRALQMDTVTCSNDAGQHSGNVTGARHILTVMCMFSRWVWLIPIVEKSAKVIAKALLERVFFDLAMFPAILRSGNAKEFMSDIVRQLNNALRVQHVFGSVYHPQSQG